MTGARVRLFICANFSAKTVAKLEIRQCDLGNKDASILTTFSGADFEYTFEVRHFNHFRKTTDSMSNDKSI